MQVDVPRINVKVYPVKDKGLDQSQHSLSEKRIDIVATGALEQNAHDGVSQYERDKGVHPLHLVLDIQCRVKLEEAIERFA